MQIWMVVHLCILWFKVYLYCAHSSLISEIVFTDFFQLYCVIWLYFAMSLVTLTILYCRYIKHDIVQEYLTFYTSKLIVPFVSSIPFKSGLTIEKVLHFFRQTTVGKPIGPVSNNIRKQFFYRSNNTSGFRSLSFRILTNARKIGKRRYTKVSKFVRGMLKHTCFSLSVIPFWKWRFIESYLKKFHRRNRKFFRNSYLCI